MYAYVYVRERERERVREREKACGTFMKSIDLFKC